MESAPEHLTAPQLEQGLVQISASPGDGGRLAAIFIRPRANARVRLTSAALSPTGGLEGDRWATNHWQKLADGSPDPRSQLSLMNARALQLLAHVDEAWGLAGDNLVVDLDLSEENLAAGAQLQIGDKVVVELTDQPHTGCEKFSRRYGAAARRFVNGENSQRACLRGRYARVVVGGTIAEGDRVVKFEDTR